MQKRIAYFFGILMLLTAASAQVLEGAPDGMALNGVIISASGANNTSSTMNISMLNETQVNETSMDQAVNQTINQTINQTLNQTLNQTVNQTINETAQIEPPIEEVAPAEASPAEAPSADASVVETVPAETMIGQAPEDSPALNACQTFAVSDHTAVILDLSEGSKQSFDIVQEPKAVFDAGSPVKPMKDLETIYFVCDII